MPSRQLFAVDGCRVHANCNPQDAEHVPMSVQQPWRFLCSSSPSALFTLHSLLYLSLTYPSAPVDLYARSGRSQRSSFFVGPNFSDVVQTFLPSGKQDRSSCHLALKACHRPQRCRAIFFLPHSSFPLPLNCAKVAPAIHFELLNSQKGCEQKLTSILSIQAACFGSRRKTLNWQNCNAGANFASICIGLMTWTC